MTTEEKEAFFAELQEHIERNKEVYDALARSPDAEYNYDLAGKFSIVLDEMCEDVPPNLATLLAKIAHYHKT